MLDQIGTSSLTRYHEGLDNPIWAFPFSLCVHEGLNPLPGQNSYGNYYLYSVSQDGAERSFFATDDIHKRILEEGLRTGDTFLVRKKAIQSGKKILTKIEFEVVDKTPFSFPENGNGHSDDFKQLMKRCVQESVEIVKEVITIPWQPEDARAIALTMFIQRSKVG